MAGSAHTWADGDTPNTTYMNALPRGVMAYAQTSANQAGISALVDATSLTVTFTAIATRLYKTTVEIFLQQLTAGSNAQIFITDGAGTGIEQGNATLATNDYATVTLIALETGLAGATTRKVRVATSAGTVTIQGAGGYHPKIVVEDLGPA